MLFVVALSRTLIETRIIYSFIYFKLLFFSLWKHFDVTEHRQYAPSYVVSEVSVSEVNLRLTGDGAQG